MKDIILREIKQHISSWDKTDIYVVSLFVYDEDDDPRKPTVTLGYNTLTQMNSQQEYSWDERDAKWNYAFWLQNNEWDFGYGKTRKYIKDWMKENHLDQVKGKDIYDEQLQQITKSFVQVLIEVVQELHRSGFMIEQFGKEIPVLIHELEYYDEIARQNTEANPSVALDDFVQFCKGM